MTSSSLRATCSARTLRPLFRVLSQPAEPKDHETTATEQRDRIPLAKAHELLEAAVVRTRDGALGLKAARSVALGDWGALDYMLRSAATVRNACKIATRYARLINDALTCELALDGVHAVLRIRSRQPMPGVAEDFLVACMFRTHVSEWSPDPSRIECWFNHDAPENVEPYASTLYPARYRFAAPHTAFVFPSAILDRPLAHADRALNAALQRFVDNELAHQPHASFTRRLRSMIQREALGCTFEVARMARLMNVTPRTLARRLESEGTTLTEQVDSLRREAALRLVATTNLSFTQIARSLGFAHLTSFYRAFKRWTGSTPAAHKRYAVSSKHAR